MAEAVASTVEVARDLIAAVFAAAPDSTVDSGVDQDSAADQHSGVDLADFAEVRPAVFIAGASQAWAAVPERGIDSAAPETPFGVAVAGAVLRYQLAPR